MTQHSEGFLGIKLSSNKNFNMSRLICNYHSPLQRHHVSPTYFLIILCALYSACIQGVNVMAKAVSGDTARSLALINGFTKIVSLIDNHLLGPAMRPDSSKIAAHL